MSKYSKAKRKLLFDKWMRNVKPLSTDKENCYKIITNALTKNNLEILVSLSSSEVPNTENKRYIVLHNDQSYLASDVKNRYKNAELFIIVKKNEVFALSKGKVINFSFHEYYTENLFKIIDRKLIKLRTALDKTIHENEENILIDTLKAVIEF